MVAVTDGYDGRGRGGVGELVVVTVIVESYLSLSVAGVNEILTYHGCSIIQSAEGSFLPAKTSVTAQDGVQQERDTIYKRKRVLGKDGSKSRKAKSSATQCDIRLAMSRRPILRALRDLVR